MLNTAQWSASARIVIIIIGTIAVGRGWATAEQVQAAASNADILMIVGGGLAILVPWFYALKARTANALIKATAKLPQVSEIQVPAHLADAIPNDKVVPVDAAR